MELKGKNVLVTGGAVRIGQALCESFHAAGANIIIHCNESLEEAQDLSHKLQHSKVVQCDLTKDDAAKRLMLACGRVDILINNASIFIQQRSSQEPPEQFAKQMQVNYRIPLQLMQRFKSQQGLTEGCIINMLDEAADHTPINAGSYLLSKRALADATIRAAKDYASKKIRVNGLALGPVLPPADNEDKSMAKSIARMPMGKIISIEDVVNACMLLTISDAITGHILYVDGGKHLVASE
jgi:pteridine reductase